MSDQNYTVVNGVKVPLPAPRIPYPQWLATQSAEDIKQRAIQKALKRKSGGYRKRRSYRRKPFRRNYGGGGGGTRPLIASIGTVKGAGAYSLSGSMDGEIFGQKYKLGGFYNSDPVATGLGEYNIKRNSLMGMIDLGQGVPRVMNSNKGEATIINHRDYLGDLVTGSAGVGGSSSFTLQTFALNPGNSGLFPFLSTIAQRFQEYEVRGCLIELKTLSSDYAASLSMGAMFAAADYNVLGPAPHTKQQLENMEYAQSCKPSKTLIMPIECDPRNDSNTHLYVATESNYQGGDKRLFDLCNVYIGSSGVPSPLTPIAEIWVTYEVALYKPIITTPDASPEGYSTQIQFREIARDRPLGTVHATLPGSNPDFVILPDGATVDFPAGKAKNYLVVINWTGSASSTCGYPTLSFSGALSLINNQWSASGVYFADNTCQGEEGIATSDMQMIFFCRMKDPGNAGQFDGSFTLGDNGTYPAGTNACDLVITEMSHDMYSYEWNYELGPVPTDAFPRG